jgi:hypothetical protein
MKIINTGAFYLKNHECVYCGKIQLTQKEFDKAIKHIMANKKVSKDYVNGSGKYAYLCKAVLQEDIKKGYDGLYGLRVAPTNYIVDMFENTSRYKYKAQNYIIQITK